MTQRERCLEMLRDAGALGVTTGDFLSAHLPRFSARLLELRQAGYEIEQRKVRQGVHHYKLLSEPNGGEVLGVTQSSASGPQCATPGVVDASAGPRQGTPEAPHEAADSGGLFPDDEFKVKRRHDQVEEAA